MHETLARLWEPPFPIRPHTMLRPGGVPGRVPDSAVYSQVRLVTDCAQWLQHLPHLSAMGGNQGGNTQLNGDLEPSQ